MKLRSRKNLNKNIENTVCRSVADPDPALYYKNRKYIEEILIKNGFSFE